MNEINTSGQYVTDTHLANRLAAEVLATRPPRWAARWSWLHPRTPSPPAMRAASEWLLAEFEMFTASHPDATPAQLAEWKRHLAHGHVRGIALLVHDILAPVIAAEERERRWHHDHSFVYVCCCDRDLGYDHDYRNDIKIAVLAVWPGDRVIVRPLTDLGNDGIPLGPVCNSPLFVMREAVTEGGKVAGFRDVADYIEPGDGHDYRIPKIVVAPTAWPELAGEFRVLRSVNGTICDRDIMIERDWNGGYIVQPGNPVPGLRPGNPGWQKYLDALELKGIPAARP